MSPTFEMLWDCQYCGTKKLLGKTHRHCPSCGGAQKPEWRYFPSDAEKVAVENHVFVGVDRVCPACKAPSSALATHCGGCGAPLDGAKAAATRRDQEGVSFAGETVADAKREAAQAKAGGQPPPPPRSRRGAWLGLGVGAAVVALVIGLVTWKKDVTVRVEGHSWRREVRIETLGPVAQDAWCDGMPGDAYSVRRSREVRSHRQIPDGEDCSTVRHDNGDGTFSERQKCQTRYRSEPVYGDRCHFTVDRWHYARSVVASGESLDDPPVWPRPGLVRTGSCLGCEREAGREARYVVHMGVANDAGKPRECDLDEGRWSRLKPGSRWVARMGVVTHSLDCSTLAEAD